jgi:hypothetical protein
MRNVVPKIHHLAFQPALHFLYESLGRVTVVSPDEPGDHAGSFPKRTRAAVVKARGNEPLRAGKVLHTGKGV